MKKAMKTRNIILRNSAIWLTVCVLLPVIAACDRTELSGNGKKTEVRFSVGAADSWGAETLTRSATDEPRIIETVSIPVENNWILEASLIEDVTPPTRALESLADGAIVRIVAYNQVTGEITENEYTYQLASGTLIGGSMMLEENVYYRFTAYSYNSPAPIILPYTADTEAEVSFSPYIDDVSTNDLILGSTTALINSVNNAISIPSLGHRFSRVKYSIGPITGDPATINVSSASLTSNYQAILTKSTGDIDPGELTDAQQVKKTEDANPYRIVYTGQSNPTLRVSGSIAQSGQSTISFTNMAVYFNAELEPSHSYILQINFKQGVRWAMSNVYWEKTGATTGYLTFKPNGYTGADAEDAKYYQGVYFKWGSLVGMSPAATNYNGSTIVYVPTYSQGPPVSHTWASGAASTLGLSNYTDIPYDNTGGTANDRSLTYLTDNPRWRVRVGDICAYISATTSDPDIKDQYRMPTSVEFGRKRPDGAAHSWTLDADLILAIHWVKGNSSFSLVNVPINDTGNAGKFVLNASNNAGFAIHWGYPFTAQGFRSGDGSYGLSYAGQGGYYWSNSPAGQTQASNLVFSGQNLHVNRIDPRTRGCAVRCIKK